MPADERSKQIQYPRPRPAMRGPYLIRSPGPTLAMSAIDLALRALPTRRPSPLKEPKRILLANWAHLGDVILTLPAIAKVRELFPDSEIGFLAGSWSAPVLNDLGSMVTRTHLVDHLSLARSGSRRGKLERHLSTARTALKEIREAGYDIAIDLYPFFPGAGHLLWAARVPIRVGWTSAGLGKFYNIALRRHDEERHQIDYHRDLLNAAFGADLHPGDLKPTYPQPRGPLPSPLSDGRPYVALHTGTGHPSKEWEEGNWAALARRLSARGKRIVFLGAGSRENERNDRLASQTPGAVNLTGQLSWSELVSVIAGCERLYCLDSSSGHLAAAFSRPSVAIMGGMNNPRQWAPMSAECSVIRHLTPCTPCNSLGCLGMYCIRGVTVDQVVFAPQLVAETESRGECPDFSVAPNRRSRLEILGVLRHFATNAVKFTDAGGIVVGATLHELTDQEAQIALYVRHTGPGVAPADRERIFDRFSQINEGRSRVGGTGLGLAIAAALAETLGGEIGVAAAPSGGALFYLNLELPLGASAASPFDADLAEERSGGLSILYADDHENNRVLVSAILTSQGHACHLVEDGLQALEAVRRKPYDLVLMDIQMPVMDGVTAAREIRRLDGLSSLPILALTANTQSAELQEYAAAGMNDCIAMPVRVPELKTKIEHWSRVQHAPTHTHADCTPARANIQGSKPTRRTEQRYTALSFLPVMFQQATNRPSVAPGCIANLASARRGSMVPSVSSGSGN